MRQYPLKRAVPVAIVNGSLAPSYLLQVSASHRMIALKAGDRLLTTKYYQLR